MNIPFPRLGFFGVIDERFDVELIHQLAEQRPDWQLVLVGPIVKIDPAILPRLPNIHYLGSKPYAELPDYLSGWDIALIPFALNESTRFISPTKTPEYLAAGKPVITTPLMDVLEPYGRLGLVSVAANATGFVTAVKKILQDESGRELWLSEVDDFLSHTSWDETATQMKACITNTILRQRQVVADQAAAV